MTPSEFKSWFEGFTEAMHGAPNKEQWTRIKKRVAEIDGKTVTEAVFVHRYWPTPYRYWPMPYFHWMPYQNTTGGSHSLYQTLTAFNPNTAMYALGRADAGSYAT